MKRYEAGIGGVSLVLIFSVLCLAVLALLTLALVNRDKSLTEKLKTSVENYYSADSAAVDIAAQLRDAVNSGETPSEIDEVEISAIGSGTYSYYCPIDARHSIFVELQITGGEIRIVSWKETDTKDWIPEDQLNVWGGE